jgi:hypothetical protein
MKKPPPDLVTALATMDARQNGRACHRAHIEAIAQTTRPKASAARVSLPINAANRIKLPGDQNNTTSRKTIATMTMIRCSRLLRRPP